MGVFIGKSTKIMIEKLKQFYGSTEGSVVVSGSSSKDQTCNLYCAVIVKVDEKTLVKLVLMKYLEKLDCFGF